MLRGPILGIHGPGRSTIDRLGHCTSFVTADGRDSLLSSPSKDHHFVYVGVANGVHGSTIVGCPRLCTRTIRRLHSNRHSRFSSRRRTVLIRGGRRFRLRAPIRRLFRRCFHSTHRKRGYRALLTISVLKHVRGGDNFGLSTAGVIRFNEVLHGLKIPYGGVGGKGFCYIIRLWKRASLCLASEELSSD